MNKLHKMSGFTEQLTQWTGAFGRAFTDRNLLTLSDMDARYVRDYGKSRTEMNQEFLADLPRHSRILEVGTNIGNQLLFLQQMGFTDLTGLEAADYSLSLARQRAPDVKLFKGSAFQLPFADGAFDLVFTSVVLIHVSPADLVQALSEIHRCSRKFIWGFEYYADTPAEIPYRGLSSMCWKRDFSQEYRDLFPRLKVVKQQLYPYATGNNIDAMFLLEKPQAV